MVDLARAINLFFAVTKNKPNLSVTIFGFVFLSISAYYALRKYRRPPLPPGPKGRYPLMRMTFDLPRHHIVRTLVPLCRTASLAATP